MCCLGKPRNQVSGLAQWVHTENELEPTSTDFQCKKRAGYFDHNKMIS